MLKKFLLLVYFLAIVLLPSFVLAETKAVSSQKNTPCAEGQLCFTPTITIPGFDVPREVDGSTLAQYIVAIYRYGGIFAGVVAMFVLVYAAWEWLLAGGNAGKVSHAREKISGTLIGLALLFGGYLLLSLISENLIKFKTLNITLPEITKICPAITDEKTCTQSKCLWVPATAEQLRANESIANYCTPPLATICPSESNLQDVNIAGLTESGCSDCRLTVETINKLKQAVAMLNPGESMTIKSAYRTFAKQQELYDCYQNKLQTGHCACSSCNEAAKPSCSAPHMTGTAVDVCLRTAIIDSCNYISSTYNCSNVNSCPAGLYEAEQTLKAIMVGAGFTPYNKEWWHFQAY